MSFYDFFHRFFKDFQEGNFRPPGNGEQDGFNNSRDPPFWSGEQDTNDASEFSSNVTVRTDILEMQKLFEQLSGVFKTFSIPEEFFGFSGPGMMQPPSIPTIEGTDPRDHYLKPEYRNKVQSDNENFNDGIEQRVNSLESWLDRILPVEGPQTNIFSSRSSVTINTVKLPDGTVKTHKIIRNPDGSEERTESQTLPDGSSPNNFDFPFMDPGFFNFPKTPDIRIKTNQDRVDIDLREKFLKPGFVNPNPDKEKADTDLDKHILQSGIGSLPPFSKDDANDQPIQQSRFFVKKTVTWPNGTVESEKVVRNSDGTEQRTVTQVFPDGSTKITSSSDPLAPGSQPVPIMEGRYGTLALSFNLLKDIIGTIFK